MGMAIRCKDGVTGQEYSFDPGRDIAYFWPQLIAEAGKGLYRDKWEPWCADYLQQEGVTEEDLFRALSSVYDFCGNSIEPDPDTVRKAIVECGFLKQPAAAQLVVLAKIAQITLGAFWAGIRHSAMQGVVPEPIKAMRKAAQELDAFLTENHKHAESVDPSAHSTSPEASPRALAPDS